MRGERGCGAASTWKQATNIAQAANSLAEIFIGANDTF
jgi:hypothetical protein